MKTALWQIAVTIPEGSEEPISEVFENVFGRSPSIYTNANSRKTSASIYIKNLSKWNSGQQLKLQNGLRQLRDAGINIGEGKISLKKLQPQDWAESWKKHFKPIQIGKVLLIKPSWSRLRPRKNQACVVLDPGLSFGTGQHATTLFCLEEMVRCRCTNQRQSFLDIGTGSGILAISAAKIGYSPVHAFDFDPEAVRISRENAKENDVADLVEIDHRDLSKLPLQSKMKFNLICANLIYDVLLSERKRIVNRLAPGGSLILAGILKTQFSQVKTAYEKMGMKLEKSKVGKEWQSGRFVFAKKQENLAWKIF